MSAGPRFTSPTVIESSFFKSSRYSRDKIQGSMIYHPSLSHEFISDACQRRPSASNRPQSITTTLSKDNVRFACILSSDKNDDIDGFQFLESL